MAILEERFLKKVFKDPSSDCWLWTGYKNGSGYGIVGRSHKTFLAHRYSYEKHNGEIPRGILVCHKCDTPACVNPDHLFLGTYKDNAQDCSIKGRNNKPKGKNHWSKTRPEDIVREENHGMAKLDRDKVIAIFRDNRYNYEIAKDYGVNTSCIQKIKSRINWRHVTESEVR